MVMAGGFATREGDVIIEDRVVDFHVWVVTTAGATERDASGTLFTDDRRAVALEEALKLAADTGGRVFSIDRARVWTQVPPPRPRV